MRAGFAESRKKLLAVALVAAGVIGFSWLVAKALGYGALSFSFGDSLAACAGGISIFDPERDLRFRFPAAWILMLLTIAYVTLSYPYRDLMGFGRSVLVASGQRRSWWLSKCAWVVAASLASCAVVAMVALAAPAVMGGAMSMRMGPEVPHALLFESAPDASLELLPFVLSCCCMMVALCLMQLALSLVVRPVLGFCATASLLLGSAYAFLPALPGNYLMVARTSAVIAEGTDPLVGVGLAVVVAVASVVLGGIYFSRMDCLDREYAQ